MHKIWVTLLKHFGVIPEGMSTEEYHQKIDETFSENETQ
jgi:hypothetical protein